MVTDAGLENTGHHQEECEETHAGAGFGDQQRDTGATDMPDPRKLAQDWITLWQSELSAMAADPEIRESWQTLMALWAGTMSTILRGLPRQQNTWSHDSTGGRAGSDSTGERAGDDKARGGAGDDTARGGGGDDTARGRAGAAEATRAAPSATAPDARDAEIERLARHLAALERRLAELERSGDPPHHPKVRSRPGPGRKPRR